VTKTGGTDLDQHFAMTRRGEFDFLNSERLRLDEGRFRPDGVQHSGFDLHVIAPTVSTAAELTNSTVAIKPIKWRSDLHLRRCRGIGIQH
jgi:hypothetical protein